MKTRDVPARRPKRRSAAVSKRKRDSSRNSIRNINSCRGLSIVTYIPCRVRLLGPDAWLLLVMLAACP